MNATKETLERLQSTASQAQFVSFTYRAKQTGERARHTILININYTKQIKESVTALQLLEPTLTKAVQRLAYQELIDSFNNTLQNMAVGRYNDAYTKPDAYFTICNGLKYCLSTGKINVSGLTHKKIVLQSGTYKETISSAKTLCKQQLREQLPIGRWREYVISAPYLEKARLQGTELIIED